MEYTQASKIEYDTISSGILTPAMAAEYLLDGKIKMRTFSELLSSMRPDEDIQKLLVAAFTRDDPSANHDAVRRRINNWVSDRNIPTNREDIFHIGFALGLNEGQINQLLGFATDAGVHYRDGRDIVYAWYLRHNGTWQQAHAMFESLPPIPNLTQLPPEHSPNVTHELHMATQNIQTAAELRAFYIANITQFGILHLKSYNYFDKYMSLLMRPMTSADSPEPNYSIETIVELYMSMHMPSGRDRSVYSTVQKLIKSNWPNTTMLKNIMTHKQDVPRKLLLFLYVITENTTEEDGYNELDEDYVTMQDRLEDHICTLNAILGDCGLPQMDPRNVYDWLVLYSLTAPELSMSEQMEKVIEIVYSGLSDDS